MRESCTYSPSRSAGNQNQALNAKPDHLPAVVEQHLSHTAYRVQVPAWDRAMEVFRWLLQPRSPDDVVEQPRIQVRGSTTGRVYQFSHRERVQVVDASDVAGLLGTSYFRRA